MFSFNPLSDIQRRQWVDVRQAYEAYHDSNRQYSRHFAGTMRWREKDGVDYLFRRVGHGEKGLGRRSPETEAVYASFVEGRQRFKKRVTEQAKALDIHAALAKTVGIGRVPRITATVLRRLDEADVLGHIRIVGTNALFAYEALAGVTIAGEALATGDVDLLLDARRRLRIMVPDKDERTVVKLLRSADRTFEIIKGKPYRMANNRGFMVDLICPQPNPPWKNEPGTNALHPDDLSPAPIEGLQWLVNAPRVEALMIDVNGYPAPIVVPDPRIWMVHKMWLSKRPLREPVKAQRDAGQARLVRSLLLDRRLPQYPLDERFLGGLPHPLRNAAEELMRTTSQDGDEDEVVEPNW